MSEAVKRERDENGVAYYLIIDDEGDPLMLMASRSPADTYRLHKDGSPWEELHSLDTYFMGESDVHTFYRLTLAQAHAFARRFGGNLITKAELNPQGRVRPEPAVDPSDGPLPDDLARRL